MSKTPRLADNLIAGDSLDRISKLPDEVLSCILSHLQTKEAVATRILSKRWEHVWTSITNLDFSDDLQCCKDLETKTRLFKDYVDNVLFHRGGSFVVEKCHLSSKHASAYDLYAWICAVACCSVQEFTIQSPRLLGFEVKVLKDLPWSIFTCKTLVVLKLKGEFVLNLPSCFSLPNLKTLYLDSVIYVDDASAQRLFSSCPCLEELDIKHNGWDSVHVLNDGVHILNDGVDILNDGVQVLNNGVHVLNISTPFLKRLSIIAPIHVGNGQGTKISAPRLEFLTLADGISEHYVLDPSPCLIEACVNRKCVYGILQGIQNVKSLALSGDIMESLKDVLKDHDLPKFQHLSQLEVGVGEYIEWSLLPKLLDSAPNLKSLIFPDGLVVLNVGDYFRRFYWRSPKHVPRCLLLKLETVKIRNFVGVPGECYLVKFLLECSEVLKRMEIHCYDLRKGGKVDVKGTVKVNPAESRFDVENAPRGSKACEVEFIKDE